MASRPTSQKQKHSRTQGKFKPIAERVNERVTCGIITAQNEDELFKRSLVASLMILGSATICWIVDDTFATVGIINSPLVDINCRKWSYHPFASAITKRKEPIDSINLYVSVGGTLIRLISFQELFSDFLYFFNYEPRWSPIPFFRWRCITDALIGKLIHSARTEFQVN